MQRVLYATSGSVLGRSHERFAKNNQDGHAACVTSKFAIGVVTDGCSSQPHSEVGAKLGASFLKQFIEKNVSHLDEHTPAVVFRALLQFLSQMEHQVGSANCLEEYFLFTFLVAIFDGERALIFGQGDGRYVIDSKCFTLDSGEQNAPNYAAYQLKANQPKCTTHYFGSALRCAVLTDGISPESCLEWFNLPRLKDNAFTLQRRLNVAKKELKFDDDATVALLGVA
jgi:hypothetical protein